MDPAPVALLTLEAPVLDAVVEAAEAQKAPTPEVMITLPISPPTPPAPISSSVLDRAATESHNSQCVLRSSFLIIRI